MFAVPTMPRNQSVVSSTKQGGAIFCVDVGSASARAAYCPPGKEPMLLDNPNGAPNGRYHPNEFSTSLYLDDPADPDRENVYRGENEPQNTGLVTWPAKFAIYRLRYPVDKFPVYIREQYPHVSMPACSEEEERLLHEAIRRGWQQMFEATREGLARHLDNHGYPFPNGLVITIPPHWEDDLELCEIVCGLMGDVFPEVPQERITSWSEPEALLRQISTERWFHRKVFGKGADEATSAIVSLIDTGGHNTGVVNCYLAFDRATKYVTIIRLENCLYSAGGGGERWEWELAELYNKMYLETNADKPGFRPEGLTLAEKQAVRDAFCVVKRKLNCHTGKNVKATKLDIPGDALLQMTISKEAMIETFNEAFKFPKQEVTKAIKALANHENQNKHVILCGGSAKNPGVQDMIKEICLGAKLDAPIANAIEGTPRYNKHAQGGALIERDLGSQDVTPKKYFGELGNVIALQLGTAPRDGGSTDWWDNCSILYPPDEQNDDSDGNEESPIYILNGSLHDGRKRMVKLICGRVGDQVPGNSRGARWGGSARKYELGHTYDLIPKFQLERRGYWGVRLTELPIDEDENRPGELKFKLELLHRYGGTTWAPQSKAAYFTLHWSAGSGCLLLFDSGTSVEEALAKMSEELEENEHHLWEPLSSRKEAAPRRERNAAARPRTSKAKGKVQKTTPAAARPARPAPAASSAAAATLAATLHGHATRLAFREGRVIDTPTPGAQPATTPPGASVQPAATPAGTSTPQPASNTATSKATGQEKPAVQAEQTSAKDKAATAAAGKDKKSGLS